MRDKAPQLQRTGWLEYMHRETVDGKKDVWYPSILTTNAMTFKLTDKAQEKSTA
jgi:hypothetical protein